MGWSPRWRCSCLIEQTELKVSPQLGYMSRPVLHWTLHGVHCLLKVLRDASLRRRGEGSMDPTGGNQSQGPDSQPSAFTGEGRRRPSWCPPSFHSTSKGLTKMCLPLLPTQSLIPPLGEAMRRPGTWIPPCSPQSRVPGRKSPRFCLQA